MCSNRVPPRPPRARLPATELDFFLRGGGRLSIAPLGFFAVFLTACCDGLPYCTILPLSPVPVPRTASPVPPVDVCAPAPHVHRMRTKTIGSSLVSSRTQWPCAPFLVPRFPMRDTPRHRLAPARRFSDLNKSTGTGVRNLQTQRRLKLDEICACYINGIDYICTNGGDKAPLKLT